MPRDDEPWRVVKTAQSTFELLELIRDAGRISVVELSDRVDMARSTVHDHLKTLELEGFVVKEGNEYWLSLEFLRYGCAARNRHVDPELVQTSLDQLAAETEETAWFSVAERGRLIHLHQSLGENALTLGDTIGNHHQLHYYASGKAILAHLPEKRVRDLIAANGLEPRNDRTITTEADLFAELEQIRADGVAYNDGEFNEGTRGVAAPVLVDGNVVGAVAVHGPTNRLHSDRFEERVPQKVKACANEIELKLIQRETMDLV